MLQIKRSVRLLLALFFVFSSLSIHSASAQSGPVLFGTFPERGAVGNEAYLLLHGAGFRQLGELEAVFFQEQELPILDYAISADDRIRVLLFIPEETPVGEGEITFLFEKIGLNAVFFVVDGQEEILPRLDWVDPKKGEPGADMHFTLSGENLDELGEPGGVFLDDVELPLNGYQLVDDRTLQMVVFLLPDLPPGETEISLFFQNTSFRDGFLVMGSASIPPARPEIASLSPHQGRLDTNVQLSLMGANLDELGALLSLTLGGVEIPVVDLLFESSESIRLEIYLPPDLPPGESPVIIQFENAGFEGIFFLEEPASGPPPVQEPVLRRVTPNQGEANMEVELALLGENLMIAGDLLGVQIGGREAPVVGFTRESGERLVIRLRVPDGTPAGEQTIVFRFENAGFEHPFFVQAAAPPQSSRWPVLILIFAGAVLAGGILVGVILVRGGEKLPTKINKTDEQVKQQPAVQVDFLVTTDPGVQAVQSSEPHKSFVLEVGFEIEVDPGEQHIQLTESSIIRRS